MKKIFFFVLILIVVAIVGFYFALTKTPTREIISENNIPPTVPNTISEPDSIPSTSTATDENSGIMFTYPDNFNYQYISTEVWPPHFISSYAPIDCELDEQTQSMSGLSYKTQTINGRLYCIWTRNEGAAGSTYTNYQVSFNQDNQYITMSFTLLYPQCDNYPAEEKGACKDEQANFPLYNLIDEIANSTSLPNY
ncbi:MAG: hypothetical protein ACK42D_00600 [Candidatus Paceibacteria bacterium]